MKKTLLTAIVLLATGTIASAQTIAKSNLKWTIGNYWVNVNTNFDTTSISRSGTGQSWDFTAVTGTADTVKVAASASFDVATSSPLTSAAEFKSSASSYSYASLGGFPADNPSSLDIGLPHTYNNTFTSSGTAVGGLASFTLNGSVPASGSVTIAYGTFNCILVREKVTGALAQTNLYWETEEHGRVAVFSGGKIGVMQKTNFSVSSVNTVTASVLNVYPNPATSTLNVSTGSEKGSVKIFNALGSLVKSVDHKGGLLTLDVSGFSKGLYVVQLTTSKGVVTERAVVE